MLMLGAVFFAYYLSATFGFGDALILLPILSFFVDLQVGIIFTGFWGFPQAIQQVIKYRSSIDKDFLVFFLPTVVPGIFLGIWLILYVSSVWMQIVISLFIITYVGYNLYKRWKEIDETPQTFSKLGLLVGGFSYGTISSWVGTPGPISIIILEHTGHYRESFIANNASIVVLGGFFKLSLYLINGLFNTDYMWLFLGGLVLCLFATKLGHFTTPKIPVKKFQLIINVVLIIVGFRMLITGILAVL